MSRAESTDTEDLTTPTPPSEEAPDDDAAEDKPQSQDSPQSQGKPQSQPPSRGVLSAVRTAPSWVWDGLVALVFIAGAVWRWLFVVRFHDPRKYVYSDMEMYVQLAKRISRSGYKLQPYDVTHPPGLTELLIYFYRKDPTFAGAVHFQAVITVLVPLVVGALGWLAFSRNTGRWAVVVTSLYLPFVDYGGYFLAEIYLTFTATVAMAAYLGAVRVLDGAPEKKRLLPFIESTPVRAGLALVLASLAGFSMSLAMAMKMVAAPAILAFLGIHAVLTKASRFKRKFAVVVIMGLFALPVTSWQAERCTRGNQGKFCPGSNKAAADFLMGHTGRVGKVVWKDPKSKGVVGFGSPAAYQHGYRDSVEYNFAITDTQQNKAAAWTWIGKNKGQAVVLGFEHVFDSFGGSLPWPAVATSYWVGPQAYQYLFLLLLLFPSLVLLVDVARSRGLIGLARSQELAIMGPIFGVALSVFMATGEARYRIPWDMCFIVLAIEFYRRLRIPLREPAAGQ